MLGLGLMLGEAEWYGGTGMIRLLTCPVCGQIAFAGAGRRQDTVPVKLMCSDLSPTPEAVVGRARQ
jgi:hypothetical protein